MRYAAFWSRFLAWLIDSIILSIIGSLLGFFLGRKAGAIAIVISIVVNWLYFAILESSDQQATLGKQALGLVVTDMNGEPISFARATGRYFAKFLSGLVFLIGYIMAAFTEKKQALHDMLAGTLVIKP